MATLVLRAVKTSELSHNELDENFRQETNSRPGNYTILEADNRSTIEYTGSGGETFTLPDGSTVATTSTGSDTGDFQVTIKNNSSTAGALLTVARDTGDTIDGNASDLYLYPEQSVTLKVGTGDDWMIIDKYNANLYLFPSEYDHGSTTGTSTILWKNGNKQKTTITGTCTYTLTAPSGGVGNFQLKLTQGGAGSLEATFTGVKWVGNSTPTFVAAVGTVHIISFYYDGTNFYGVASLGFPA